jgi:hypothetical protein
MEFGVEILSSGKIYVPSFMKIGVQAILKFSLKYLRDCNVGVTDGVFTK